MKKVAFAMKVTFFVLSRPDGVLFDFGYADSDPCDIGDHGQHAGNMISGFICTIPILTGTGRIIGPEGCAA